MESLDVQNLLKKQVEVIEESLTQSDEIYNVVDDVTGKHWLGYLAESHPSDLVVCNHDTLRAMFKVLNQAGIKDLPGIPGDIFEAETIPLPDVIMQHPDGDRSPAHIRVLVHPEDRIGYFAFEVDGITLIHRVVPVVSEQGSYWLEPEQCYVSDPIFLENMRKHYSFTGLYTYIDQGLKLWYSLQVLLLNPQVKDILLKKDGKEKLGGRCCSARKDGRKALYVKRHVVHGDIFEQTAPGSRERHTLSWYVIGHWRNYKSGKKTFVNGYWKGPMRHMEKNLDDGRERVLPQEEAA